MLELTKVGGLLAGGVEVRLLLVVGALVGGVLGVLGVFWGRL